MDFLFFQNSSFIILFASFLKNFTFFLLIAIFSKVGSLFGRKSNFGL